MTHNQDGKRQPIETNPQKSQGLKLANQNFKVTINQWATREVTNRQLLKHEIHFFFQMELGDAKKKILRAENKIYFLT